MKKALHGDLSEVWYVLLIMIMVIILVLLAVGLDLYYGKKKSKELGIYKTHSWGLRKTSEKATWYGVFLMFMVFADVLVILLLEYFGRVLFPFLTVAGGIALIYTEFISVREKVEDKMRKKVDESAIELVHLIKNNKEILEQLIEKKRKR
ncbi:hypothetical protein P3875_04100 [Myroides sp. JBRI-B21084]|uniref:hypothetical protein n=1 Tax=Myroides sp. JBRI-B21084 TaxID=3119977 RepID=UPI0026E13331|nr:hypothetical protein [Paenimyroides cloacae]WKW47254.1 hypothetical protein P3875_04100 [Paenimyroides cloacae]